MHQQANGQILYSPSDLVTFLGCNHASFLDFKALNASIDAADISTTGQLLAQKGLEHEAAHLQSLKDAGFNVTQIPKDISLKERSDLTIMALKSGVDIIYQAVFLKDNWRGDADFLIKIDTPSKLGQYSYEVLDTKLARTPEPKHIMQLCAYSELLKDIQGILPENMYLYLGDHQKHHFRTTDFFYYYKHVKKKFSDYTQNMPQNSYPEPCSQCSMCRWREGCKKIWQKDDHLSLLAGIQRSQIEKLHKIGITTIAALAICDPKTKSELNPDVFTRLQAQAKLQHHKVVTGEDIYELMPEIEGKGFSRLPKPNAGDLFFDMEGDPLYPNGLEYLFGIYYFETGKPIFKEFWAHDHAQEKETFKAFMAFLEAHFKHYPNAHIYHYNHYETTALKRLAGRYASCEEQLDNLLRQQKFIDLYVVARESIRTSEPGLSIKKS